jgi:hypothetical protein
VHDGSAKNFPIVEVRVRAPRRKNCSGEAVGLGVWVEYCGRGEKNNIGEKVLEIFFWGLYNIETGFFLHLILRRDDG